MSALQLDPKELLSKPIEMMGHLYGTDLKYVPEDKLSACPMGVARSAHDFTVENIGFNNWVADALAGVTSETPSDEARAAFAASFDSYDKLKAGIDESVAKLLAAIQGCSDEQLAEMTTAPWGEPMPKFRLAMMPAMHMMYHCGQLNYIQALYGDAENHWAG